MYSQQYKRYVLFMLLTIYILNFVDRQILALLMEPIKLDLSLSDTQLGFMSGIAFAIFYTALGIPIARLADKSHRVNIISCAVATWSGMTVLSGMAGNFWQLLLARIGVGIGEAGCTPPAHSLIADYFSQAERSRAIATYMLGVPLGILLGFLVGGWVNEIYGWRIAFIAMGIPGLFFAVITKLTVKEPFRSYDRDQEDDNSNSADFLTTLRCLWGMRSFRYLVLAMTLTSFVGSASGQWQATFFIRTHEMTTGELGVWLSMMAGLCGAIGIYLGGLIGTYLGLGSDAKQMKIMAVVALLLMLAGIASLLVDNKYYALGWVGLSNLFFFLHYGPAYALVISLAPAPMRAMASAIVLLLVNLIGSGFGPQFVGVMSDILVPYSGVDSLRFAIISSFSFLVFAIGSFWAVGLTVNEDLDSGGFKK